MGENTIQGMCEMREIWSECVTARKEEEVRHVSPFPLTQRLSSVAPLVPRFALERRFASGTVGNRHGTFAEVIRVVKRVKSVIRRP